MTKCTHALLLLCVVLFTGCRAVASYQIDNPSGKLVDDYLVGRWRLVEDTNKNNFYEVLKRDNPPTYHIRFWNRGGTNPTYEGDVHVSEISGYRFVNVPYWERHFENGGYFFLRLLSSKVNRDSITTAMVSDTTMRRFQNSKEVRMHIVRNLKRPSFYSDTLHFYRIR